MYHHRSICAIKIGVLKEIDINKKLTKERFDLAPELRGGVLVAAMILTSWRPKAASKKKFAEPYAPKNTRLNMQWAFKNFQEWWKWHKQGKQYPLKTIVS